MANKQTANHQKSPSSQLSKDRFSKPALIVFAVIFAGVGLYFLLRSFAAPVPPTVYLTQPNPFMPINTSFSVQVRENSATTGVNAVQANISYPSSLLSLVNIDTTGTAFTLEAQNTGGSGTITLARGTCGGCAAATGDQLIATLNFKTLTTGGTASPVFTSGTALVNSSTNQDILGGLGATAGFTVNVDTTPPAVGISSPTSGNISAGSTVTVTMTATDADHVTGVDLYINGSKVTATPLTTAPYTYSWNTSGLTLGSYTLQAKASDPSGNQGVSTPLVTINLVDLTPPTTAIITSPTASQFVKGTVTIAANASDNPGGTGISKVEFYDSANPSVPICTDIATPYNCSWVTSGSGSHSLTIKAYDSASPANVATSSAVAVTVDNTVPSTPGSLHSTSTSLNSISLAWTASTDNNSVVNYQLSRNGSVIGTLSPSTLTFNDTSLASATTYSYSLVALDAAGNASIAATLSVATQTPVPGDVNGDGHVTITDLSTLLSKWNTADVSSDLNHNGVVDIFDLSILLSHYGL